MFERYRSISVEDKEEGKLFPAEGIAFAKDQKNQSLK